ncbi:hypothetical protein BGW80DRAFT_1351299 [Lactifluus volemus]|nr:hypothetical protein BGW80DRAFT_1351299 [Lactifluus volemus]
MAVVTKMIRLYIFVLQLIQFPMIAVARSLAIKRKKFLGNAMIRLALYAEFPHSVRLLLILCLVSGFIFRGS